MPRTLSRRIDPLALPEGAARNRLIATCLRKTAFPTERRAKEAVVKSIMEAPTSGKPLAPGYEFTAYTCDFCHQWHVGRRPYAALT